MYDLQDTHRAGRPITLLVRPELVPGTLRLLNGAVDQYDGDLKADSDLFLSVAEKVRNGEPIDLTPQATSDDPAWRVGPRIVLEASYAFQDIEPIDTGSSPDWRYLSDLAALAADIEAAMA